MSATKRSAEPQHVRSDVWYYEDAKGFGFVVEADPVARAQQFTVPIQMIRESLGRYPKPKGRKLAVKK